MDFMRLGLLGADRIRRCVGVFEMDDLQLLMDLHRDTPRQGPGGDIETRLSIEMSGLNNGKNLRIADIGCGTGASTCILAEHLDATIVAVDLLPEFLNRLEIEATRAGFGDKISPLNASMVALPFSEGELDAIWSEGAIYNMGFEAGLKAWHKFLKPDGILAVSELTWLTHERPEDLQTHWEREYSEVDTSSAKMAILEKNGYLPIGYFALSERCWLENYYRPLQLRFAGFLERHGRSVAAKAIVAAEEAEITLYERHKAFVSYGYYIARKIAD